ncbi:MAG: hypothetical protein AAFY22_10985 [Pseudomonadota bacterium]
MDVRDHTLGLSMPGAERDLFAQVLNQAILDLNGPLERDKKESILLLTETQGDFARHRDWLCSMAGLDPVAFFEKTAPLALKAAEMPIAKGKPASKSRQAALDAIRMEAFQ